LRSSGARRCPALFQQGCYVWHSQRVLDDALSDRPSSSVYLVEMVLFSCLGHVFLVVLFCPWWLFYTSWCGVALTSECSFFYSNLCLQ
jgi:hypothetical protein